MVIYICLTQSSRNLIFQTLGGWNLSVADFDPSKWELQEVVEQAQNVYSRSIFFEWSVTPDELNSSRHVIAVSDRQSLCHCTPSLKPEMVSDEVIHLNVPAELKSEFQRALGETCEERADPDFFRFQLDQSGLTLPSRDYYVNDTNQDKAVEALSLYFRSVSISAISCDGVDYAKLGSVPDGATLMNPL